MSTIFKWGIPAGLGFVGGIKSSGTEAIKKNELILPAVLGLLAFAVVRRFR